MPRRRPKRITYADRLDRYNARHERARSRGKRWAEEKDHVPYAKRKETTK